MDDDDDTYDPATAFWTDHVDAVRAGSVRAKSGSAAAALGPVPVVRAEAAPDRDETDVTRDAVGRPVRAPLDVTSAAVGPVRVVQDLADAGPTGTIDAVYELAGNSGDYDVYEV